MAAKDSDIKQWTDPKDYGLPFVEITPLHAKPIPVEPVAGSSSVEIEVEQEVETLILSNLEEKSEQIPSEASVSVQEKPVAPKPVSSDKIEQKKTAPWVWLVLVLGLAIIAFIIWQIQSQSSPSANVLQSKISDESSIVESTSPASIEPETTTTDQSQDVVNQDTIPIINNSNPNISKPAETGTTIANTASGNLIRVESKGERPQYFIIVGSLPNEKLAIEEANQYFSKSPEIYLISPEEGLRNYRLALSRYDSFRLAAEELEQIKSQYTEELWILKY